MFFSTSLASQYTPDINCGSLPRVQLLFAAAAAQSLSDGSSNASAGEWLIMLLTHREDHTGIHLAEHDWLVVGPPL